VLFNVNSKILADALNKVARFVNKRVPIPLLSYVLIQASKNRVRLTCGDLETFAETSFPAQVEIEADCLVPVKGLQAIANRLPDTLVTLQLDNNQLLIDYGGKAKLSTGLVEEYPVPPAVEGAPTVSLNASTFKKAIRQVSYAAGKDELRPIFTGVFFKLGGGFLRMVASDTHRLAEVRTPCAGKQEILVPAKPLLQFAQVAERCEITANDNAVRLSDGEFTVTARQIEGKFPDYEQVIPKDYSYTCKVEAKRVLEILDRVEAVARQDDTATVLVTVDNGLLNFSTTTQVGAVEETIAVDGGGEVMTIGFNITYLKDALRHGDEATLKFTSPLGPAVVEYESSLHLVLPVRPILIAKH